MRKVNRVGQTFGRLTILEHGTTNQKAKCQCSCGTITHKILGNVVDGKTKSCGCLNRETKRSFEKQDLVGQKFGMLTILEKGFAHDKVLCQCDCGNQKRIRLSNVKRGISKSCGCLYSETQKRKPNNLKHGMRHTLAYNSWHNMKQRCNNPNTINFHNYGGRGVTYDPRWEDFQVFFDEMGERPPGYELDKDKKGGPGCLLYCKENCCWIPKAENSALTRRRKA